MPQIPAGSPPGVSSIACREYLHALPVIDLFVALDVFRRGKVRVPLSCTEYQSLLEKFLQLSKLDDENIIHLAEGVASALKVSEPWRLALKNKLN